MYEEDERSESENANKKDIVINQSNVFGGYFECLMMKLYLIKHSLSVQYCHLYILSINKTYSALFKFFIIKFVKTQNK